jgi:plastocyanin
MIWLWLICFSCLPAMATTISGRIVLRDSRVAAVKRHSDYSDVVVWLEGKGDASADKLRRVTMVQKDKTFSPHILPVVTGTIVDFPNADPIFHNAFSSYSGQIFDVGLYPPGKNRAVRFNRPGVVRLFCNIHPTMSAIILVINTQYFSKSGADGRFSIEAAPGDYEMRYFHERATDAALSALTRKVTLRDAPIVLPEASISEAGFLPTPHKNKYGKDYEASADDNSFYPGARQTGIRQ